MKAKIFITIFTYMPNMRDIQSLCNPISNVNYTDIRMNQIRLELSHYRS